MNSKISFDPKMFSEAAVRLVMAKAEAEKCSPSKAFAMLLDEMAEKAGFKTEPKKREVAA